MRLHQAGWTITRISITDQLVEYCKSEMLAVDCYRTDHGLRYRIDGTELTPEQAADAYLGGFAVAFGRSGDDFDVFLGGVDDPAWRADGHHLPRHPLRHRVQ